MASLAETMFQSASKSINENTPDLGQAIERGAQLALKRQQLQQSQAQIEAQKQQILLQKYDKFGAALEKADKIKDERLRGTYLSKYVPRVAADIGLPLDATTLEMLKSSPEARANYNKIRLQVASGALPPEEGIALLQPEELAAYGTNSIVDSAQAALLEKGKDRRAQMQAQAVQQRADIAFKQTGPRVVAQKIATDYTKFNSGGGLASAENKLEKVRGVLKDLEQGKIETGTTKTFLATSTPLIGGEKALAKLNPKVKAAQDTVRSGINLKSQLDSQFGDKAMNEAFARGFDPNLPTEENIKKLRSMVKELEGDIKNKVRAFRQQGLDVTNITQSASEGAQPKGPALDPNMISKLSGIAKNNLRSGVSIEDLRGQLETALRGKDIEPTDELINQILGGK